MPQADLTLRRYRPADLEAVVDLWYCSWSAAFPALQHPLPRARWKPRFAEEIAPRCQVWVAERTGRLAGFLAIDTEAGYMDQLFIGPADQRRGVGTALIAKAKALCPARIALHALQANPAALAFYEKHGFVAGATGVNPVTGQPSAAFTWTSDTEDA